MNIGQSGGYNGGSGFSGGGGGDGECNGGSGGSKGGCESGGPGTGEDVSTFTFDNFKLSPGEGGEHNHNQNYFGGGGGGILINDEGPSKLNQGSLRWSDGKGYGGGGTYGHGQQGIIIVEVVNRL